MGISGILGWGYTFHPTLSQLGWHEVLPARSRLWSPHLEEGSALWSGSWCSVVFSVGGDFRGAWEGQWLRSYSRPQYCLGHTYSWMRLSISTEKIWAGPWYSRTLDWPWSSMHAPGRCERAWGKINLGQTGKQTEFHRRSPTHAHTHQQRWEPHWLKVFEHNLCPVTSWPWNYAKLQALRKSGLKIKRYI